MAFNTPYTWNKTGKKRKNVTVLERREESFLLTLSHALSLACYLALYPAGKAFSSLSQYEKLDG